MFVFVCADPVDPEDPNRLDNLYPPQISGWLAVTAVKMQFRLV
jgi:hypothetical protein